MYRAIFPVHLDDQNNVEMYDVGVVPVGVGVMGGHFWHSAVNHFTSPEAALARAQEIAGAFIEERGCPCGEWTCRLVKLQKKEPKGPDKEVNQCQTQSDLSLQLILTE